MAKQVWLTTDGSTFETKEKAEQYDLEYNVRNVLQKCMSRDYETCINAIMSSKSLSISYLDQEKGD